MIIGERIRYFRDLRGLTQKELGIAVGFPEQSADTRIAQYEVGIRTPKADLINLIANVLEISPLALAVPNVDSCLSLMHTLFALEDKYGLEINISNKDVCLKVNVHKNDEAVYLHEMFRVWHEATVKLKNGQISQEEYDRWRYNFSGF
jgi:transcriptional regulator with XRE-family HTH domain